MLHLLSKPIFLVLLMLAHVGLFAPNALVSQLRADQPSHGSDSEARHFTLEVLPLLTEKCLGCHGSDEEDLKGDYDVRTREVTLLGGESGEPAIVPGHPEGSPFYQAVLWEGLEMPPKENDRLTEEQTAAIRRWIKVGAPWPEPHVQDEIRKAEWKVAENEDGVLVSTSGGLADEWTYRRYQPDEVWAFQPLATQFDFDSVDGFIDHKIRQAGIQAAPQAKPQELIRRATLDLIGLPPMPEEIDEFLAAWDANPEQAWGDLIDRLLASPHYGERWAQHWLDVVRYSDTGGFSNDYERSNAWRYRDYVIRALNNDRPYDEFVKEQIAGDEYKPESAEARVATGFLRMGPWDTAMVPQEEARQIFRDDVVHSIGQSFLSMPMRCCKCHDHKFDPIPTRDYYRMYAAISASQPVEIPAEFLPEENLQGFETDKKLVEKLYDFANGKLQALVDKREAVARKWYEEHDLPYKAEDERKDDPEDQKPPRHAGLSETEKGQLKVRQQDEWIWNRRKERFEPLAQSVFNGPDLKQNAKKLRKPKEIDMDWRPQNFIHSGGALSAKGEEVTPGVLSGCGIPVQGAPSNDPFALTTEIEGRRLGLVKWIVDPKNPLTARSLVNRIWQHHFGSGIVATPNNLGVKGAMPTHPELLDFLATQFIRGGWKWKPLHRQIMMSDAYKRSSTHPDPDHAISIDGDNQWLARFAPRRLTAEELRDSLLVVTGELNRTLGGLPIRPEINMEVALQPRMIQFSIAPAYQPSATPQERNRRTVYAYRVRGQADPFLEVLNQPNPNDSCDLRDDAAVSPQAFTLLNSSVMSDRSIALAKKLRFEDDNLESQVRLAFERTLGRPPTIAQQKRMLDFIAEMAKYHRAAKPEPVVYPTKIVRSLVEEFSGETFEFDEILPVFENYTPDAKPDTVDVETRALADMCLLLFNTNEFIYVY